MVTLLQEMKLRSLLREQAVLEGLTGNTPAPVTVATTTTVVPKQTPSPALVTAAAAEGITYAQLLALTPAELNHLEALVLLGLA